MTDQAKSSWFGGLACLLGVCIAAVAVSAEPANDDQADVLRLPVRWQEPAGKGDATVEKTAVRELVPGETAILICDTWNEHWCKSATQRCGELAKRTGRQFAADVPRWLTWWSDRRHKHQAPPVLFDRVAVANLLAEYRALKKGVR